MLFLQTKGTGQIPDFIQVRDENFALIGHFKVDRIKENVSKYYFDDNIETIIKNLENLEYGVLLEIK